MALEQRTLRGRIGIAQRQAHQEAVELALRQRMGADLLGRILGGDDEEGRGQAQRLAVDADLMLLHRLQQRALGARPGPVDLVGQQHLGEDRALMEDKALAVSLVDTDPDQVAGREVGGELHPGEAQSERGGQGVRQRGLADAGHVLDQQVAPGEKTGDTVEDLDRLADHHRSDLSEQALEQPGQDGRLCQLHVMWACHHQHHT